ncbi:MAG: glycoside hydrolase family 2 protein [Planctomycetota bacterium]|jgi:hypothetical protein
MHRLTCLILITAISATITSVAATKTDPCEMQGPENTAEFIPDVFSLNWGYREQIELNGIWEFRRDANGEGKNLGWHEGKGKFADSMTIPGAPQAQGFGEPHKCQKTYFPEPFWVRRTYKIRQTGPNERLWLRVGAVFPAAEVYLNGTYINYTKSSRTQQRVDVTDFVKPGAENLIAIKVCKLPKVHLNGMFEFPLTTQFWKGVYRSVKCEITDRISVIDLYAQPKLASNSVSVDMELSKAPQEDLTAVLRVAEPGKEAIGKKKFLIRAGEKRIQTELKLDSFKKWSPQHPQLYTLDISLIKAQQEKPIDKVGIRFGMKEISVKGTKFYLNGNPVFLRAYGDDHYYPDTLCPPADVNWYLSRLKLARKYGLNAVKSCVDTITQDYLEACDEAGIMVIQEMPFGLSSPIRHKMSKEFRDYYACEFERLLKVSRNHASIIAYSMSSELKIGRQTQESFDFFSKELPLKAKKLAPNALVIDCTGYLKTEETPKGKRITDFYASMFPKFPKRTLDETGVESDGKHPTILHEYDWWSCYPDVEDKKKYANSQLKPFWLDTLLKTARENGQEHLLKTYRKNSLWLQALTRKDGIEFSRRNTDIEGYILWLLIDFGKFSEGLLDDFWNPKNVSAQEFMKSNGDTIIVLAKEGNRCFDMAEKVSIPLAVSHYGQRKYPNSKLRWKVARDGITFAEGELTIRQPAQGELTQAGCARFNLLKAEKGYKFELEVSLHYQDELINTNNWSFWAFPKVRESLRNVSAEKTAGKMVKGNTFVRLKSAQSEPIPEETSLVLADSVDESLVNYVEDGGKCILFTRGAPIENTATFGNGRINFYPLFRAIAWNLGDSGNSGTIINDHPSLEDFPHESMCDLQFIAMLPGVIPMEFSPLRKYGVTPIIRGIDHYKANRNNAHMLEFNVGRGKVLVTSMNILSSLNKHIEVRNLLQSMVDYAKGPAFSPEPTLPKEEFMKWFTVRKGQENIISNENDEVPDG